MPQPMNVALCVTEPLWRRGAFHAATGDLTEALGGEVIGATVWETPAGAIQGPYHFHDGVEEWMYVVSGAPVLRDPSGRRPLAPGALVAFAAGPDGAHTFEGPGRVVMFSVGARGWGEGFTSVYLDADTIAAKPGVRFRRSAAVDAWPEPAVSPVAPAPAGPCPQVDLRSCPVDRPPLAARLHTRTWRPSLHEIEPGATLAPYRYDWCREHWALVVAGTPSIRHPDGRDTLRPGDVVCLPEGETGAHQFANPSPEPARLLLCCDPVGGPSASVHPEEGMYVLRVPGQMGYRFRLADTLDDYWDGEPDAW